MARKSAGKAGRVPKRTSLAATPRKERKAFMAASIPIVVRLKKAQLRKIERWIKDQRGNIGQSEAIRRLLALALKAKAK